MRRISTRHRLLDNSPGGQREVLVHRYGDPGGRKAYMHAALHADETPGMLVLHHLIQLLDGAAADGRIAGEIVVVPYANPIGLSQHLNGEHVGRYEMGGGGNFNRNWPDLAKLAGDRLDGKLGADANENVATIRAVLKEIVEGLSPRNELESLRKLICGLAIDADIVFDIHCDDDALMHIFMIPQHWPLGRDLAAQLEARAVLLAEDSGGGPFDEACSMPWVAFQRRYPDVPILPACFASTLELRGRADVNDSLALKDAQALFRSLQCYGLVEGDPAPLPEALCDATDLEATDSLKAPAYGILSYALELGQEVKKGDLVAWLIDPAAEDPSQGRIPVHARSDGFILSRRLFKYLLPGQAVCKVVGTEILPHRAGSYLLED